MVHYARTIETSRPVFTEIDVLALNSLLARNGGLDVGRFRRYVLHRDNAQYIDIGRLERLDTERRCLRQQ